MTQEWKDCPTIESVVEAKKRGDEIHHRFGNVWDWMLWNGDDWHTKCNYRSRAAKKTKTIVLREALIIGPFGHYFTRWCSHCNDGLIKWLDTPAREFEVEL